MLLCMPSIGPSMLAALLAEQRELDARLPDPGSTPEDTLAAGEALLRFASREGETFSALAPLLDPAAQAELAAEHQQFAQDLELLDWIVRTTPDSPDVQVLTASLGRRMRQHVDRDRRLLVRAAGLAPRR
jgi:hypothetical protein